MTFPVLDTINVVGEIINKFIPDKNEQARQQAQLAMTQLTQQFQSMQAQIEVNKNEASSSSIFIAGWRPWIGWVCGAAFTFQFIVVPLVVFIGNIFHYIVPMPAFDTNSLIGLLTSMLGLGVLRTYEKAKNINSR